MRSLRKRAQAIIKIANYTARKAELNVQNHTKIGVILSSVMRNKAAVLCAMILVLSTASLPLLAQQQVAQQQNNAEKDLKKVAREIDALSIKLNKTKSNLKTERDQLFEAEKQLRELNKKSQQTTQEIDQQKKQLSELEQTLIQLGKDSNASREALKPLLRSRYINGDQSRLKQYLNQEDPYALGRLQVYNQRFSSALVGKLKSIQSLVTQTTEAKNKQRKTIATLRELQQEQDFLAQQAETQKAQRAKSVAKLTDKVSQQETQLSDLKNNRERLNTLLKALAKQAQELKRIEEQRREAERQKQIALNKPVPKPVERMPVQGGFAKQKGRLKYPVSVAAKTKFGSRIASSGMRSEGVFFDTKQPQAVNAIFRGRVLFADFLKGYGLLLIVDHGDDHISLYGHNSELYKRVGDEVKTGETIAKTGTSGGLKSAGLYFEIRNNTSPVNPANWCQ